MKITPLTVLIFALCISAVIITIGLFNFYLPRTAEAKNYIDYAGKLQLEANKLPRQKKNVEEANQMTQEAAQKWQSEWVSWKTPPTSTANGGINLATNRWYLVNDAVRFRNRIQQDINRQLKVGGVKVINGPTVPSFPDNPLTIVEEGFGYPDYGFPVRVYDFGSVTVEGSMAQIRQNVQSWSNIPRYIAVTDGLRVDGTPPRLRATYNLSMVMYIQAKDIHPPVPEVPGEAGAGAPGGGVGGGLGNIGAGPGQGAVQQRGIDAR